MDQNLRAALLRFDPANCYVGKGSGRKDVREALSAATLTGSTLWAACDESVRLERLTRGEGDDFGRHEARALKEFLDLPAPESEEADIEGLDSDGEYLWLIGSHSLKNGKPDKDNSPKKNRQELCKVTRDGNRCLLARIPLVEDGTGGYELARKHKGRTSARLTGDDRSSALTEALVGDKHFGRYMGGKDDGIPGKDNGFDIEGLAVHPEGEKEKGVRRVFVGLRGPVLRGWAAVLELRVGEKKNDPSLLNLRRWKSHGSLYRKHFLDLGGLGIRDLAIDGKDLLILAGPTMDLDGPVTIFRWPGGAGPKEESVVFSETLREVASIPFGIREDHAEGMAVLPHRAGGSSSLLLVYDAPSAKRLTCLPGEATLQADLLPL